MRSTDILAIALGMLASTASSARTGPLSNVDGLTKRGPQSDDRQEAVFDSINRALPAASLKSRGTQLDTRAPQDPVSDAINRLRPGSSRRSAQAPDTVFQSIEESLNPSSRRSAQAPDTVFQSIEESLNPSGRKARSPQVQGRIEDNDRPNIPQAQGPSRLRVRIPQGENRNENQSGPNVPQAQSPPSVKARDAQAPSPDTAFQSIEESLRANSLKTRDAQRLDEILNFDNGDAPPASSLKTRKPQGGNRIEDRPANDLPQASPPSVKARDAQAPSPDAAFQSIEESLRANSLKVRDPQRQGRVESGPGNNVPSANPPSVKARDAQKASNKNEESSRS